jgi:hypothetical protein
MELEYSSVDEAFALMRVPDVGSARYAAGAEVPFADLQADDSLAFSSFSDFAAAASGHSAASGHAALPSGPTAYSGYSQPAWRPSGSGASGSGASGYAAPPVWRPASSSAAGHSYSGDAGAASRANLDGVAGAPAGAGLFVAKESLVVPTGAPRYDAASMYSDDSRVSCSDCRWVLEDRDWCCKHDCNDKSSPHYRQAYVCADPTDKTGKLTSRCEIETECRKSEPPLMCDATRLSELQRYNTTQDPSCAVRPGLSTRAPEQWATSAPEWATSAPGAEQWATSAPRAEAPWATSAPGAEQWATSAPRAEAPWATSAPGAEQWATNAPRAEETWATQAPWATSAPSAEAPWATRAAEAPWATRAPM